MLREERKILTRVSVMAFELTPKGVSKFEMACIGVCVCVERERKRTIGGRLPLRTPPFSYPGPGPRPTKQMISAREDIAVL